MPGYFGIIRTELPLASLQEPLNFLQRVWSYIDQEFSFGRIKVSLSSLLIGLVVLVLTFTIARSITSLIERRLGKRHHIDPGIRYTISRLVKYVVVTVGVLVALKQAFAIDLTSIAVIFTALSVGIGFGLQYLAADIASGFILLFERPVRVGDRVKIGDDEGDVQSINLRTTTLFTDNRTAVIVPNSKLVTQRVVNWSYGGEHLECFPISVSVARDSDVDAVTTALLNAANDVQYVSPVPQPKVEFLEFGKESLDFRLLVWTNQPRHHAQIKSEINFRIARLFNDRGIKTATTLNPKAAGDIYAGKSEREVPEPPQPELSGRAE